MALIRVSEAEAVRDIASLLAKVRAGAEIEIEADGLTIAALVPRHYDLEEPEPGYDEWFRAQVQEAMDDDPANDLSAEEVEEHFAALRAATLLKLDGVQR